VFKIDRNKEAKKYKVTKTDRLKIFIYSFLSPSASLKTGSFFGTVLGSQTTPVFFHRGCESPLPKHQSLVTCSARVSTLPIWYPNLLITVLRLLIIVVDCFCLVKWRLETCKRWFISISFLYNLFSYLLNFKIILRHELKAAEYIEKLPKGCHSVKGLGSTEPDPACVRELPNGTKGR
jgi:hypothetical protein